MVNCQKLKKRSDFQNLTHKSQAFKTPAFILLYADESAQPETLPPHTIRLGYTATKRSIGNAVKRNSAKRRLRALADELIRLNPKFKLPEGTKGADMVFIARTRIADAAFDKMRQHLAQTLKDMGCTLS